jgi:site-specific DNA-methyltransferase (adenine-specific)
VTIYYQDDAVTLHHGDCLEVLSTLSAASVAHVVTDPPYILQAGSSSQRGSKTGGWADMMNASHWYTAWLQEASRTLSHHGSAWVFGNWRSLPVMMRSAIDVDGLAAASMAVWDKDWIGPGGPQQLRSQHEICLVLAREGFIQGNRSQGDVLRVKASSSKPTGHPAEKPLRLMSKVLALTGATAGDTILDPFAGSGTVAVAASAVGLRCISIEAEERWCEIAARRLSQGVLNFEEEPA